VHIEARLGTIFYKTLQQYLNHALAIEKIDLEVTSISIKEKKRKGE